MLKGLGTKINDILIFCFVYISVVIGAKPHTLLHALGWGTSFSPEHPALLPLVSLRPAITTQQQN